MCCVIASSPFPSKCRSFLPFSSDISSFSSFLPFSSDISSFSSFLPFPSDISSFSSFLPFSSDISSFSSFLLFLPFFLSLSALCLSAELLPPRPSHFLQKRSPLLDCPEVPKDVQKGSEGEVCYRRTNGGPSYFFVGIKIAGEPDSKIYKAYMFMQGIWPAERGREKTFAVKVVSTGTGARAVNLAKPPAMIKHELHMLKVFNEVETNKPVDEQSVVKLFTGDVVVDKSPMVVAHDLLPFHLDLRRDFSMIYVMEFGDSTLDKYLTQWDELVGGKWGEEPADEAKQYTLLGEKVKQDAERLLVNLANTLATFHKYAVHLHLKPGNWIFVREEDKWKLIDLQSAIPNFEQGTANISSNQQQMVAREERFPEDFVEFACNSLSNEIYLTKLVARANERPSTYASPEHIGACKRAHPMLRRRRHPFGKKKPNSSRTELNAQLMLIGPKCDVWSFGVLMLEILAHTPQVNPPDQRADPLSIFIKMRAEFVSETLAKVRMGMRQHLEEFVHFRGRRKKVRMDGQKLAIKLGKYMQRIQRHFPAAFRALLRVFVEDQNKRAEMREVVQILSGAERGR